jgi:hypothetical protein
MGDKLTNDAWRLLLELRESADHGAFAVACDGKDRKPAHELDGRGFARWCGTNWGSSFWSITEAGRQFITKSTPAAFTFACFYASLAGAELPIMVTS